MSKRLKDQQWIISVSIWGQVITNCGWVLHMTRVTMKTKREKKCNNVMVIRFQKVLFTLFSPQPRLHLFMCGTPWPSRLCLCYAVFTPVGFVLSASVPQENSCCLWAWTLNTLSPSGSGRKVREKQNKTNHLPFNFGDWMFWRPQSRDHTFNALVFASQVPKWPAE